MSLTPEPAENADKGRHYEFIKSAINNNFKTATVSRSLALAAAPLHKQAWYTTAPAAYLDKLAAANLKAWGSQNPVDHLLDKVDLYAFAEPLLKARIKDRHGLDLDVKATYLRLYMPKDKPWYVFNTSDGVTARTVSLLDAALHNFASSETVDRGSEFISKPDERGLFDVLPIRQTMSVSQFQTLCRDLDIGGQFQKYLDSYLRPGEPVAEAVLEYRVKESQKDALAAAAHLALIKEDIEYDAYKMLLNLAEDKLQPVLNGRSMQCCDLSILGTRLAGILLMVHAVRDNRGVRRVIVYVPHDPEHPLKEYRTLKDFREELTRQLREDKFSAATRQTYRQFFSQFVDQQQRGHFFAELEQRLFTLRYHQRSDPTDQRPAWRKEPVANPNLRFDRLPLQGNYWRHAYQQKFNKILNDARDIAVSTADTDSKARWAWWDNFKKIVADIFNAALLIATPFVPGLGELMMVYTAFQLTNDVIEGLVDLAEGLWQEAAEHVISVVTDVIQLAAFAAGAKIGGLARVKLSALVDGMKPVTLPDGTPSLWHRDLKPYERNDLSLAQGAKPDSYGLHQYRNENILPLEGKLYTVEKASAEPTSNTHRINHPTRPNAYKPQIEHNGHGAWVHEAESPHDWDGGTLMRRVGHSVERFSPAEREQIRISSGTDENQLRQMHLDSDPPPPLLADTIKRFSVSDDVRVASANIRQGRPIDPQAVWFEPLLTSQPGWPRSKALKVYDGADPTGYSRQYGNPAAGDADTLSISLADLTMGRLPERLTGFLDDSELKALLGRDVAPDERAAAVRNLLADAVDQRQGDVATYLYKSAERSKKADVRVVQKTFPNIPLPLAEKVVTEAKPAELQRIVDDNRLPLRLKAQARELDFEASTARAYSGFYRDEWMQPDTERMALKSLLFLSDPTSGLRIEVRDGAYDGTLRCSLGADDEPTVRRLIRDEHGRYEVLDDNNRTLHEADDFYESLLYALPDEKLRDMGYRHGEGPRLKAWLMEYAANPAERRIVLAEPPIQRVVPVETQILLRGWRRFFGETTPEQRVKQLYPKMSDSEAATFVKVLKRKGGHEGAIQQLENERKALKDILQRWRESYPPDVDPTGDSLPGPPGDFLHNGGRLLEERLIKCFERRSKMSGERSSHPEQGYTLDLSTDLARPDLDRWWRDLRRRQPDIDSHLARITALNLDNANFSSDANGLLGSFPHLQQLSARGCGLTEVIPTIGKMRQLRELDLSGNRISLTGPSSQALSDLTDLQTLNLNGNPLRNPPDIGRMDQLRELSLANTEIQAWPPGLFELGGAEKIRPRSFMLNMRGAPINSLPEVRPGSDQAFILSRTRFDSSQLSTPERNRYYEYRRSAGFPPTTSPSFAVATERHHWETLPHNRGAGNVMELAKYRMESWNDVWAEPDSAGFFAVIDYQRNSEFYKNEKSRPYLTQRVWEMIDAVAVDSQLREQLFSQITSPENSDDVGAQLFNSMGIKVLVAKAYAESPSAEVLEDKLVRLAHSAARIDRLSDLAKEEISRQAQQTRIDPTKPPPHEMDIHMAFEAGLAERLELPWQSTDIPYEASSGVNQKTIDAAYDAILQREAGDGQVNGMIDLYSEPFWERHLRDTHPDEYAANDLDTASKKQLLNELREAQAQWADAEDTAQLNPLARRMMRLADQLNIDHLHIFSGERMSQARYNKLSSDIVYASKELSRKLTRTALKNAGLST
ncbi:DUF6543 domain-containing protein [Pseudomonas sp. A34-9]|uniref:dermonecrotic toxin domain-containing protein n=1 Tax=Pseudomonas sp. A34-9 TaxID=3034675 RepID=UPI00240E2C46|nr:DUF6543 domain-containing protein [Pseudomonas sp. A34-9]